MSTELPPGLAFDDNSNLTFTLLGGQIAIIASKENFRNLLFALIEKMPEIELPKGMSIEVPELRNNDDEFLLLDRHGGSQMFNSESAKRLGLFLVQQALKAKEAENDKV